MATTSRRGIAAALRGVTRRYGGVTALDAVDLEIEAGRVTALLGPNGAGKTTAVRCLLGLTAPDRGSVEVFGGDPRATCTRWRLGAMLQVSSVPETLRVREHLDLFASYYPDSAALADVIEVAGLAGLEERSFGSLSGGEKQRLVFALALCGDPDLLFLDEPTVGLDVAARRALWRAIRHLVSRGRTVLLTTHYLEEADALADRVVVIDHGRIVADGSPDEIKGRVTLRCVRCRTALDLGALRLLPGVQRVERGETRVELLTRAAEDCLRELLRVDPALSELEVVGAGLEEAFLSLTAPGSPSLHGDVPAGGAAR